MVLFYFPFYREVIGPVTEIEDGKYEREENSSKDVDAFGARGKFPANGNKTF